MTFAIVCLVTAVALLMLAVRAWWRAWRDSADVTFLEDVTK